MDSPWGASVTPGTPHAHICAGLQRLYAQALCTHSLNACDARKIEHTGFFVIEVDVCECMKNPCASFACPT